MCAAVAGRVMPCTCSSMKQIVPGPVSGRETMTVTSPPAPDGPAFGTSLPPDRVADSVQPVVVLNGSTFIAEAGLAAVPAIAAAVAARVAATAGAIVAAGVAAALIVAAAVGWGMTAGQGGYGPSSAGVAAPAAAVAWAGSPA